MHSRILLMSMVSLAALACGSAMAQDAGAQRAAALEEVVVTARKRTETIQDVPLSITAFSEASIAKAAIADVRDVAKLSPNVTFQSNGGNGTGRFMPNLTFRGLQNIFPQPRAQVGAVFVDGTFVLGGVNAVNTADVERVEVLRGPQNAYFGRNTFAGAINFITKTPGDEFKGQIDASGSVRSRFTAIGSLQGPVVEDRLAARTSVYLYNKRGDYVAQDGGRLGNEGSKAVTLTLYATPTDKLSVRIRGNYQNDDDGPGTLINLDPGQLGDTCKGQRINKGTTLAGATGFNVTLPYFCGSIPGIGQLGEKIVSTNTQLRSPLLGSLGNPNSLIDVFLNNSLNEPQWNKAPKPDGMGLKREIRSINLQTQYEFDSGISVALMYGYEQNFQGLILDTDRSTTEQGYAFYPTFSRVRMAEARIRSDQKQRFRWLVGGTYFNSYFASNFGNGGNLQYQSRALPTAAFRTAALTSLSLNANPRGTDEVAHVRGLFGSVDFDVTQSFLVTGELRWQKDTSQSGGVAPPNFTVVPNIITFKDLMPRVIGTYKITPDWNVYASWSRGVLPGVENSGYTSQTAFRQQLIQNIIPNVQRVLSSDKLDSYEIGSKQTLLDGKLRYNLAAYYMKWRNAKAQTALVLPATSATDPTPFIIAGVTTQGTVAVYGLELEGAAALTRQWEIAGGLGLQKSKFLKWGEAGLLRDLAGGQAPGAIPNNVGFGAVNWEGNEMQRQPRMTANLNTTYRDTLSGDWDWFVRGEVTYTGSTWDSTANIVKSTAYARVNARLGFDRKDLTVELYVTNLLNDKTWDFVSRTAIVDLKNNAASAALPLGNFGFLQGISAQAPNKRDFGIRAKYAF